MAKEKYRRLVNGLYETGRGPEGKEAAVAEAVGNKKRRLRCGISFDCICGVGIMPDTF